MLMVSVVENDAEQFVVRTTVHISGVLEEAGLLIENQKVGYYASIKTTLGIGIGYLII